MDSHRGDLHAFDYRRTASPDLVARGLALVGHPFGSSIAPHCTLEAVWLGHRSITSTAVYTALAPNRFKDFWR
jgi:hypothetical protein